MRVKLLYKLDDIWESIPWKATQKKVQNDCYDNFSKIRTKTVVFKNYVTL